VGYRLQEPMVIRPSGRYRPQGSKPIRRTDRCRPEGPMRCLERERPCKSERMGESEESRRSVMVATATSCEGKCQPEGWLPPTGRVGGVSVRRIDGFPTQGSMPARRDDDCAGREGRGPVPEGQSRPRRSERMGGSERRMESAMVVTASKL
jgi:hypothetical protein